MDEKEMNAFSWPGLFFVTGFCFFAFSRLLKFLDGNYPAVFLWIAMIMFFLGLLTKVAGLKTSQ